MNSFINLWSSRCQFYRKHYHPLKFWLATQIVRMGMHRQAVLDSQAASRGELSQAALAQRLSSYKQVINIWQDSAE
jgi:hypothetical protein